MDNISLPLREVYVKILIDVLKVLGITTTYVRRGSLSSLSRVAELMPENYLRAIVKTDDRLLELYNHLNTLVIHEVAATTSQLKDEMGRLALSSEAIIFRVQALSNEIRQIHALQGRAQLCSTRGPNSLQS